MLGLIAITPNMVPWFYGEGFEAVIPLLIVTSPIILAIGLNNVTGVQYLIQTGKQNIFTISVTVGAVINVIFNFVLIKIIGTVGASISSVLAEVIILFVQLYYLKEEITIKDVIEDSFKYIISGIIMAIIVYGISLKMNIGIISTLIQIIIGGIIYVLVLIILKDELIKVIISQIATKIKVGD